jgi:hypothetical protein
MDSETDWPEKMQSTSDSFGISSGHIVLVVSKIMCKLQNQEKCDCS